MLHELRHRQAEAGVEEFLPLLLDRKEPRKALL